MTVQGHWCDAYFFCPFAFSSLKKVVNALKDIYSLNIPITNFPNPLVIDNFSVQVKPFSHDCQCQNLYKKVHLPHLVYCKTCFGSMDNLHFYFYHNILINIVKHVNFIRYNLATPSRQCNTIKSKELHIAVWQEQRKHLADNYVSLKFRKT